jgi:hypothetical protein
MLRPNDLHFHILQLDIKGYVHVPPGLYDLFQGDEGLPFACVYKDSLCHIKLLELAGLASLWAHRKDHSIMKKLGKELLGHLQVLAKPEMNMPVVRYREELTVLLLGQTVRFDDFGKKLDYTGTLEGLVRGSKMSSWSLRISGKDVWQMEVSEQALGEGTVAISRVDITTGTVVL